MLEEQSSKKQDKAMIDVRREVIKRRLQEEIKQDIEQQMKADEKRHQERRTGR